MKTIIATALLTVMFLSAGAFASVGGRHGVPAAVKAINITVAVKNQAWPLAGRISVEPCGASRCIDI